MPEFSTSDTNNPRGSVVLACYYIGENSLRETVASVLRQTSCFFELLIIDDGSMPAVRDVLGEYLPQRRSWIDPAEDEHQLP
ncbi:MAG: glycosyltransferase [Planctomycetes bacterium]|nr:glycosyltransferase [Planctomycetota bacterium]